MYGYVGVFLFSFLGSIILFIPGPYLIPVASLSLILDPTLVALSSTMGSVLAKFIIFRASYLGSALINPKNYNKMKPLQRLISRHGSLAAFIASATPVPDDLVYIPLGIGKFNPIKFIIITFIGKLMITLVVAWGSHLGLPYLGLIIGNVNDPLTVIISGIIFVTLIGCTIYLMFKADWEKILSRQFPRSIKTKDNEIKQKHDK